MVKTQIFLDTKKLMFAQKNFQARMMMSDRFGIRLKMFTIVKYTQLAKIGHQKLDY
jgi:hypothetical protein